MAEVPAEASLNRRYDLDVHASMILSISPSSPVPITLRELRAESTGPGPNHSWHDSQRRPVMLHQLRMVDELVSPVANRLEERLWVASRVSVDVTAR